MPLLRHLVRKGVPQFLDGLAEREIEPMNDGGMSSHQFTTVKINRKFSNAVAECQFLDADGVTVLATLNVDAKGDLFELDVWKTDFSSLLRWPAENQLLEVSRE